LHPRLINEAIIMIGPTNGTLILGLYRIFISPPVLRAWNGF